MSGPKVDTATLRQQRMEKLMQARQQRLNLLKDIDNDVVTVMNMIETAESDSELGSLKETCEKLEKLRKRVKRGNEMFDVDSARFELNTVMKPINDSAARNENIRQSKRITKMKQNSVSASLDALSGLKKKVINTINEIPSDVPEEIGDNDVKELAESIRAELETLAATLPLTVPNKKLVLNISSEINNITDSSHTNDVKLKRLKRLYADNEKMTRRIVSEISEMNELYNELRQEYLDFEDKLPPITSFENAEAIEEAIEEAKLTAAKHVSHEYIRRSIDEVMAAHGYNVMRSDVTEQASPNDQILYDIGDDSAINVFVSDDNSVSMRVVGVGFDENISAEEDEKLFRSQCAFCAMHPQITAELAMRGVVLTAKKHLPPDRRFNKKIKTSSDRGSSSVSRSKKELKRRENRVLHMEKK